MKKTNKPQIVRQGDVLLLPVSEVPKSAVAVSAKHRRLILAYGEVTGHHHSIAESDNVSLLEIPSQSEMFLLVEEGDALLEHQEHAKITVPSGSYRVVIQREWDPTGERRVQD